MKTIRLNSKVIQLKNNAAKFLQGLTSNSLDKPLNAFLNIHGRIIATVEQLRISDDDVIIVVHEKAVTTLIAGIERFARLNKTVITVTDLNVYHDLDNQAPINAEDYTIPLKAGRLVLTAQQLPNSVSEEEYTAFRLSHHLPAHTIDYQSDEMILNVHEHDYVSYTKGCFLGQEPVAKVHHRAKPTWKLVVKFLDECTPEEAAKMTSQVKDAATGRIQGFVFVKNI